MYKSILEMNNLHSVIHFRYIDHSLASAFVVVKCYTKVSNVRHLKCQSTSTTDVMTASLYIQA